MEQLWTSLTIIRHSLGIMRRHPRLLVFPLVAVMLALLIYAFVLAPQLLDKTVAQIWDAIRDPHQGPESIAPWHAHGGSMLGHVSMAGFAAYYLLSMLVATFLNVALYSQIIAAMNGRRVSIARGFAVACARLPAIVAWSLLAATVGVVLRAIQERAGFLVKGIAGLANLSWAAATLFVIPVMINEPRPRTPFDYLKISSTLVKRVWGEGVIGVVGVTLVGLLILMPLIVFSVTFSVTPSGTSMALPTVAVCVAILIGMLLSLTQQIFGCGLYVYATEGVAPGTFSEEFFDRVWTFRGDAIGRRQPELRASRRSSPIWLRIFLSVAVPVVLCGPSILWVRSQAASAPKPAPPAVVSMYSIDLADLGYTLTLRDFQSVGLFRNTTCAKCDFSASGTWVQLGGKIDDSLQANLSRKNDHLYLTFSGPKYAFNQLRAMDFADALKARFPGHALAFSPVSAAGR